MYIYYMQFSSGYISQTDVFQRHRFMNEYKYFHMCVSYFLDDFDVEDFYNRTGHKVENMVLHCSWKGEECSPSNFTHVFTHLGNCYTFNKHHEDKYETHKAGNNLQVVLFSDVNSNECKCTDITLCNLCGYYVFFFSVERWVLVKHPSSYLHHIQFLQLVFLFACFEKRTS